MRHALRGIGGEVQAPRGLIGQHHGLQPGLMDGNLACLQRGHLGRIDVHAYHFVAHIGQHRALHQADIAGAKNRDFHDG